MKHEWFFFLIKEDYNEHMHDLESESILWDSQME